MAFCSAPSLSAARPSIVAPFPRFSSATVRTSALSFLTHHSTSAITGKGKRTQRPMKKVAATSLDDEEKQIVVAQKEERCFAGTPYIPVYVMLPLDIINKEGKLAYPELLTEHLEALKSQDVNGVMVDCWWGIVEGSAPRVYNWEGYKHLLQIVRQLKLKIQVVMSFHECGGNIGDSIWIPLPEWVLEIGENNPDIYFKDREGRHNAEGLTWGIDKKRVLHDRTAIEVYFDFMRNFRVAFDEFFEDKTIFEIQVGMGPCGELRYPSYPAKFGWVFPGIGQFQCYDAYLMESLQKAAIARGHPSLGRAPPNAGSYNSHPQETGFFRDGGDFDNSYGRFFLGWYSNVLIEHGDLVLSLAKLLFEDTCISVKISGIHWWYKTASHAAEVTSGFYNPCTRNGYAPIAAMLKKHGATLNFTCVELRTMFQEANFPEAKADPEGLVWQVLNSSWDANVPMASENAMICFTRDGYNKILDNAKPSTDPDCRHLSSFTYLRLSPELMVADNLKEFGRFVKRMHGEWVPLV